MEKIRLNSTSIQVKKISLYILSKMLAALKKRTKSRPEIKKKNQR